MSVYMVAYDISSDRRRTRVAKVLGRYGSRVQESVFEVRLMPDDVVDLRRLIGPLLDPKDSFDIYPIDERGNRRRYRWMREPETWKPVILC